MAISLTCPGCATGFAVPDTLAGKWVKCKSCGTAVEVEAAAPVAARPASRPPTQVATRSARPAVTADDEYVDDTTPARRPAKAAGGSKLPLILAAVGTFVAVGGGLGGYLALSGGKEKDKPAEVAATQPAVNPTPAMASATPAAEKPAPEKPASEKPPAKVEAAPAGSKPADLPAPPKGGSGLVAPLSPGAVAKPPADTSTVPTRADIDQISLDKSKAAAVYIECETHTGGGGSGSGWFGLEPNLVWTNAHVISMIAPGSKKPKKLTIWTSPGTPQSREIPNNRIEILAVDRSMDLALLRVNNEPNLPPPMPIRLSSGLRDLEKLVALGYPGGKRLSYQSRNTKQPHVTVNETKVQALGRDDNGDLYTVQVSGGISWGNSGGPMVDAEGRVVAVSVRVDLDPRSGNLTGIAYGVPTEYVSGLLAGRIGEIEYGQAYRLDKQVHIPVTVTCLDPFDRVSKVGFGCWVGERTGKPRPPGAKRTGEETGDTDFREVELTYKPTKDKKVATGELVLPEAAADRAYWAQPFYANGIIPKHWMAGNAVKMLGAPVDREAVELSAVFKPGTVRSVTLQNKNSLVEFEEGEGADREDRGLLITQVTGREATLAAPKGTDYAAQLRMRFEKVSLTAEKGPIKYKEQQVLPKEIRKAFAEGIKLCEGYAFLGKAGDVLKTQADVRRVPGGDLNQRVYKEFIIDPVMDSLLEASVGLPNKRVQPGDTWKQVKSSRLAVQFLADPRVAPNKKDDDDDDKMSQRPGQPKARKQIKGLREYKYQEETTYKYVGVRTRQGVKEAVVEVSGEIKPAAGASESGGATGKVKGYACLDLDTGTVIESEVDREFEIDSSIDGTKRRLSAINNYRITRSTPSAGTN